MNTEHLNRVLSQLSDGEIDIADAQCQLSVLADHRMDGATIDHSRELRCGFPEVVFGEGKSAGQIATIAASFRERQQAVLVTRVSEEKADDLAAAGVVGTYEAMSRLYRVDGPPAVQRTGRVAVVAAGTSDRPVAAEAAGTLEFLGVDTTEIDDVGVAGLHRLLDRLDELLEHDVVIVVAGMEGALPSVVGGLLPMPIIAVPTSVGYGASFQGMAALLGMLSSCASGISVVNIDNGFGAACAASRILRQQNR
jgi:NCAIR mutase (PurE)-related protein